MTLLTDAKGAGHLIFHLSKHFNHFEGHTPLKVNYKLSFVKKKF